MTMTFQCKGNNDKGKKNCVRIVPPIPFEKPAKKPLSKEQCHAHELRSSPTNTESPTHDLAVPCFSTGACEECLMFLKNFEKVKKGQNVATDANKFAL